MRGGRGGPGGRRAASWRPWEEAGVRVESELRGQSGAWRFLGGSERLQAPGSCSRLSSLTCTACVWAQAPGQGRFGGARRVSSGVLWPRRWEAGQVEPTELADKLGGGPDCRRAERGGAWTGGRRSAHWGRWRLVGRGLTCAEARGAPSQASPHHSRLPWGIKHPPPSPSTQTLGGPQ